MKNLSLTLLILFSLCYAGCKKNNGSKTDGPGEIYGNWKLTERLADPGDGSGKYVKVKENKYLTFSSSGKVEGDALPDVISFKILDSVRLELVSNSSTQPYIYRYKVSANALTLNPPCFEGCGLKFIRK